MFIPNEYQHMYIESGYVKDKIVQFIDEIRDIPRLTDVAEDSRKYYI